MESDYKIRFKNMIDEFNNHRLKPMEWIPPEGRLKKKSKARSSSKEKKLNAKSLPP